MDKITPENPPPSTDDLFETDPFGDSFANMKVIESKLILVPNIFYQYKSILIQN